jgi:hypothetical protein
VSGILVVDVHRLHTLRITSDGSAQTRTQIEARGSVFFTRETCQSVHVQQIGGDSCSGSSTFTVLPPGGRDRVVIASLSALHETHHILDELLPNFIVLYDADSGATIVTHPSSSVR